MRKLIFTIIIVFFISPILFGQSTNLEEEGLYMAKKAYEDGFYAVALSLFERFLNNFPQSHKSSEAALYIAQCYFQQNKFIDTLTQLKKLSSDPKASNLKDAVLFWMGEVHFRKKDFPKAISFYQSIIKEFPHSHLIVHAYYSRGWSLFETGDYNQAIKDFAKVVSIFPDQPLAQDAQFKILECLYNLRRYEELNKEANAFQKKYPEQTTYNSWIQFLLAESNFYLNDYQQAIQEYQIVLRSSPDENIISLSQLGLAWCYLKLKDYTNARESLKVISPDNLTDKEKKAVLLAEAHLFAQTQDYLAAGRVWSDLKKIANQPSMKMQAYLGEAESLYNLEQYQQAIAVYKQAEQIKEELPSELLDKLHYGLAWAFLKDGQFKEAIDEFQKAASFASDDIIRVAALCQVGDAYQDAQDYQETIQVYDQILKDYPNSPYADYVQYQLGLAYLRLSRYDEAILAFRTLLSDFSDSKLRAQTVYSLALAFFKNQEYRNTQETIQKYMPDLKNKDLEVEALYLLATSSYSLGKFSEAMSIFKQVIRKAKDIKIIQKAEYEIADCLYQMDKEKEALQSFKVLRAKYPDSSLSPEVTWWLGGYYLRKGDFKLSRRYFSTLIRDFPESSLVADGYYALGILNQEENNLNSAIENFNQAMNIGTKELMVQSSIAVADILVQQGKFNEAEIVYQEAIKKSPNSAGLIYPKISLIYEKKGDFDQAIRFYQQALSMVSIKETPRMQFSIARAYENKGDYYQAIQEYLKIPDQYSTDSHLIVKAYLSSAQIYENQEDWLKAKDLYLKVASMDVEEAKYAKERLGWINNLRKE